MCGLLSRTSALAALILSGYIAVGQSLIQDANSESAETGHVRGVVINSVTREPIGHALVFSPDNRFATMTDAQGHFEFGFPAAKNEGQNQQSGPSALRARKPGFLELDKWAGATTVHGDKEVTIALAPEAIIAGRVTLASAEPSDRIEIQLSHRVVENGRAHWVNGASTMTRSNGDFRFADLAAGIYKVFTRELLDRDPITFDRRGQQYGYPPVYFPNAVDFASANVIQLTPGKVVQADISITRQPYYQIKIPVINAQPSNGVEVIVSAQGRRGPGFSLGYDSSERVITGMLPNGTYGLELVTYGQNTVGGQMTITVKGGPVEGPPMALSSGAAINVNVKEEFTAQEGYRPVEIVNGARRRNLPLSLWLEPADDFGLERTVNLRPQSKPDDTSLILEAQAGRYWVRGSSSQGYIASITSGDLDLMHQPLVVGHGGATAPIEVTLRNDFADVGGTIEGVAPQTGTDGYATSVGPSGPPSAFVYCVPSSDSSGEFREITAGPDGSFELGQIPPGTYRLLAFDSPQRDLEYSNPEAMHDYDSRGQVVRLMGGQKGRVRLQVIATSE